MPSLILNNEYLQPSRRRFAGSRTTALEDELQWSTTNGLAGASDRRFTGKVWVLDLAGRCSWRRWSLLGALAHCKARSGLAGASDRRIAGEVWSCSRGAGEVGWRLCRGEAGARCEANSGLAGVHRGVWSPVRRWGLTNAHDAGDVWPMIAKTSLLIMASAFYIFSAFCWFQWGLVYGVLLYPNQPSLQPRHHRRTVIRCPGEPIRCRPLLASVGSRTSKTMS